MYGMQARRPSYKSQPFMGPKAVRQELKPDTEWIEDPSNRYLHVQLPGFRREDFRVQLDSAGKLLIKGSRQVSDYKQLDVSQSFDVPKNTIIEKISGRFEDGHLTLTMPKRVVEEQEAKQKPISKEKVKEPVQDELQESTISENKVKEPVADEKLKTAEGRKEEEPVKEEAKTGAEEKKDEPMREEKPASLEEINDEPMHEEKTVTTEEKQNEPAQREKPTSSEGYKDEAIQEEKPRTAGEKKDDGHALEEKMERDDKKNKDGSICQEKMERSEEKKDELAEQEKSECIEERMKEDLIQTENTVSAATEKGKEAIQKVKSKMKEICLDTPKELRKRISAWRGAEERWLDSRSLDDILEKMNKNREVIAVAVVAFSIGFYVSHRLRTRG